MNNRYSRKKLKESVLKILMIPIIILISFLAVRVGIEAGNFLYRTDVKIVKNIETDNFKDTINSSLPIINTIYNSGNISVSFSNEIKNLIGNIFNFDLDSPLTILNVQSTLFMSYYNKEYKSLLAKENQPSGPETVITPENKTPDDINKPNNNTTPNTNTNDVNGQKGQTPGNSGGTLPQVASSITYEEEKDEEKDKSDILTHGKITIQNYTSYKIDIEQLLKEPLKIKFEKKGPKVLIYHSHTSESYVTKAQDLEKKGIASYNSDPRYNVVRVGEELTRYLKKYNISVLHNGTKNDTNFPAAYGASLKVIQKYVKSYPSLKILFDLHRDGVDSGQKLRLTTKVKGKSCAQVMFVVGTDGNRLPHPNWKENLKFALKMQQYLNEKYPGLVRPIWISKNRYNQHLTNNSLIIEIGGDGNLLSECLESTKYVAEAVNSVINKK